MVAQLTALPLSESDLRHDTDRGPIHIIAQVDEPPKQRPGRLVLQMRGISRRQGAIWHPATGRFRLTIYGVPKDTDCPCEYGDQLEMDIALRAPGQFENPGVFPYADYQARQGSAGMASLSRVGQVKKVGEGGYPFLKKLYRWRDAIRTRILVSLSGVPEALLLALVVGDAGLLTDTIRDTFSASGTTHILSISGSHLAFVALLVFGSVRWLILRLPVHFLLRLSLFKIPSQCAALATALTVTVYALLAGGELATIRSLTMILVYLGAIWLVRDSDIKISLAVAALLILAFHPQAIFDISFQLSFVSVLSILLTLEWSASPPQETGKVERGIRNRLTQSARIMLLSTLGATVGTAPLTLYYFHQFSWVGLLANPFIIPVAGGLIVPLGLLSALAIPFVAEGFPLAGVHQAIGTYYFEIISWFARLPGASAHFASPPLWVVVIFYGVTGYLLISRASWKRLLPLLCLFFSLFLGWGRLRLYPETLQITALDVGQGDATLFEFPNGKVMLVDAGSGGDFDVGRMAVAPYLWQRGIQTVDYLVGTHPQMDHMGGLDFIVRAFSVGEVWTNGMESDAAFYSVFRETLRQQRLIPKAPHSGTPPMQIGDCSMAFLNPPKMAPTWGEGLRTEVPRRVGREMNNRSIVFRLVCDGPNGDFSILMTGDIEREGQLRLREAHALLRSTILKVPHHGAHRAFDPAFLSAVAPRVAIISAGRRNRYRHPHPDVVTAYESAGVDLHRTDQQGALFIEAEDRLPQIRSHREEKVTKIERDGWRGGLLWQKEWGNIKKTFR